MRNLQEAIERIKILECPTGEVENRVAEILEGYGVADTDQIRINRNESLDKDGLEAYNINISGSNHSMVILAKSGLDDYVAKVVDVYNNLNS